MYELGAVKILLRSEPGPLYPGHFRANNEEMSEKEAGISLRFQQTEISSTYIETNEFIPFPLLLNSVHTCCLQSLSLAVFPDLLLGKKSEFRMTTDL